jgi:hypothetical protein
MARHEKVSRPGLLCNYGSQFVIVHKRTFCNSYNDRLILFGSNRTYSRFLVRCEQILKGQSHQFDWKKVVQLESRRGTADGF